MQYFKIIVHFLRSVKSLEKLAAAFRCQTWIDRPALNMYGNVRQGPDPWPPESRRIEYQS